MGKDVIFVDDLSEFEIKGQYYRKGNIIKSIVTSDCVLKSSMGFDYDKELAYKCNEIWKEKGYSGNASSPASFFNMLPKPKCNIKYAQNAILQKRFNGGWIECIKEGITRGTVYHYDLKKAYFWAGSLGLPTEIRPYKKGDKNFICVFEQEKPRYDIPNKFEQKIINVTNEDIELYNLKGKILKGWSWDDLDFVPNEYIKKLDFLPKKAYKRLTQSYWGLWASAPKLERQIVELVEDENGNKVKEIKKTYYMTNRHQNFIYATIIVNRVIRKVYEHIKCKPISVYVDSILCSEELPTGEEIGDWNLKNIFKEGVFVRNSGNWTPLPNVPDKRHQWHKHSGYSAVN